MVPAPNLQFYLSSRLPSMFQPVNRVDTVFLGEKYSISYSEPSISIPNVGSSSKIPKAAFQEGVLGKGGREYHL
jgi:hypothetical protein